MKYQLDPLSPTGVSPVTLTPTQIAMSVGGSGGGESLWEANTYGTDVFLQPIDTTNGLVLGSDLHSSLQSFGFSAVFNDSTYSSITGTGINYFANLAYGTSFIPLGGIYVSGHARGTSDSPTQTLGGDYLGGFVATGYSGSGWITSAASHILPGLYISAVADVATYLEENIHIGGLLTPMIGFETDTNAIKFNEAALDSDMTFYSDTGTPFYIDGAGTGKAVFGSTTTTSGLVSINGDLYFHKETARTIQVDDTTTAATAGAALSIAAGAGSATTSGTGGALTLTAGAGRAGNSGGGAITLTGGVGVGLSVGGNVTLVGGAALTGGSVVLDGGSGVANGRVKLATTRGLVSFGSGSAAAPTLVMESSLTSGFYRKGADNLGISLAGTLNVDFAAATTTWADAVNFAFGTTTGTKIGTATTQKIGFWNTTPIVQPTTGVAAATLTGGGGTTITDTDTFDGYTLKQIVKALRNIGLLA